MSENIVIKILEKEETQRNTIAEQRKEWGLLQRGRLVEVLEKDGAKITNNMWDMLLFNINALRIVDGKICYISFYNESKRISSLLLRHNKAIMDNFKYITKLA